MSKIDIEEAFVEELNLLNTLNPSLGIEYIKAYKEGFLRGASLFEKYNSEYKEALESIACIGNDRLINEQEIMDNLSYRQLMDVVINDTVLAREVLKDE